MILINKVIYDKDAREADVELISNDVSVWCYCHPVESVDKIYDSVNNHLIAFQVNDIVLDRIPVSRAKKTSDGYYSYLLTGKVISNTKIQVNDLTIDIGMLPKDVKIGEHVSCNCLRLDMIIR